MHDSGAVRVLESLEDAVDVAHRVLDGHRARGDDVLQERAVHEFHHDVRNRKHGAVGARLTVFTGVVDSHDRGVRHARGRLCLETEAGAERIVVREVAVEELDRDLPTERQVVAAEHGGHTTAPDEFVDAIAPRKHARLSCHGHSLGGTESA